MKKIDLRRPISTRLIVRSVEVGRIKADIGKGNPWWIIYKFLLWDDFISHLNIFYTFDKIQETRPILQ